jgi:hypothetical protein
LMAWNTRFHKAERHCSCSVDQQEAPLRILDVTKGVSGIKML